MSNSIYPGLLLRNHYLIVRQLGQGGFGRTYLAKDQYRFDELCVLKEFAPQVQGSYGLKKSEELFEREAQILYRLNHPQIPKFRELFREKINHQGHLFVVQDYVAGLNYRDLLQQRQQQNSGFTEAEIIQIMQQLLPVLAYIHERGVIHRDISPDNIICRQEDQLPVLIDFGGVKQIQAKINSEVSLQHSTGNPATRLGKVGYAPDEQMRLGVVYPHSDLYALGATVLVLLTGKEPQQLMDNYDLTWDLKTIYLSPRFAAILTKILAPKPSDRYPTAQAVLRALESLQPSVHPFTQPPPHLVPTEPITAPQPPLAVEPMTAAPIVTIPNSSQQSQSLKTTAPLSIQTQTLSRFKIILFVGITMIGMGTIGWVFGNWWVSREFQQQTEERLDLTEVQQQQNINNLRRQLGINNRFFTGLVDEEFYRQYPEQQGRALTNDPKDIIWRQRWNLIAEELLNQLQFLSLDSRQNLGQFSIADIRQWQREVNELYLSSRALYDLSDAQFYYQFPDYPRTENVLDSLMGQVWQGITADQLQQLKARKTLESVRFRPQKNRKTLEGMLKPGTGKAYIANLKAGQFLQVDINSSSNLILLSIYTPISGQSLIEDSQNGYWSGKTQSSGYYEFIVISKAQEAIDYELRIQAE